MKITHYSGGYVPANLNFVLSSKNSDEIQNKNIIGIIDVIENILFRGEPSKASLSLTKNIGKSDFEKKSYAINPDIKSNWNLANDSKKLFDIICSRFGYKASLFEYNHQICQDSATISPDEVLTFYAPILKFGIQLENGQFMLSSKAEKELGKVGITVIHVFPDEIVSNGGKYLDFLSKVLEKNEADFRAGEIGSREFNYIFAFRFQVAILESIRCGLFDITATEIRLSLPGNKPFENIANYAFIDLMDYLQSAFDLANIPFFKPKLIFSEDADLVLDIGVFKPFDSSLANPKSNEIIVRDDYYLHPSFSSQKANLSTYRDYYHPLVSDFRFNSVDRKNEKHHHSLLFFLKILFGFDSFRPQQEELIQEALSPKKGVIGLLPTGSGKSICYQMVSFLTPGLTVIVSPLSLLMRDQCENLLNNNGITRAKYLNSSEEGQSNLIYFVFNNLKMLYISPERFFNASFSEILEKRKSQIGQIVIDEVHCLSEWGHDFRTSYLLLFVYLKNLNLKPSTLLMGVTATASLRVVEDVKKAFEILKPKCSVVKSFTVKRKELTYNVVFCEYKNAQRKEIEDEVIRNASNHEKTIVFVPFRKDTEEIKKELDFTLHPQDQSESNLYDKRANVPSNIAYATYTGGQMNDEEAAEKAKVLENFKSNGLDCVIATKAFGMGIDIPDVRHTIHYGIGSSVESVYQEMGRAGRDEKNSTCTIVFYKNEKEDANIQRVMSPDFDIKTLKDNKKLGELSKQLLLLENSQMNPADEATFSICVYNYLCENNGSFCLRDSFWEIRNHTDLVSKFFYFNKFTHRGATNYSSYQAFLEKCMYKLVLLKLLDLWTIDYHLGLENPTYSNIVTHKETGTELTFNLQEYISRYDVTYKQEVANLDQAVYALCDWSFQNFFVNRWNSLRTIYDFANNFHSSSEFEDRIENYFMTNDDLANAAKKQTNIDYVFRAIDRTPTDEMKDQVARYIEEYDNNISVNLISGIARLRTGEFNTSPDGAPRYKRGISGLRAEGGTDKIPTVFRKTYSRAGNDSRKREFCDFLTNEYWNDRDIYSYDFLKGMTRGLNQQDRKEVLEHYQNKKIIQALTELKKALEEKL